MITSKWFKESEFQKASPPCSLQDMTQSHMDLIDKIRDIYGSPMIVTSAYRSEAWEKSKGRTGIGDHPQRTGMDIKAADGASKYGIVNAAIKAGCTRIGIDKGFVHIGSSKTLPQNTIWLY